MTPAAPWRRKAGASNNTRRAFHDRPQREERRRMDIAIEAAWPSMLAAFLASLVEFVEALTVVLAVGVVRGWRPALTGACLASVVLLALIALFGPMLQAIPLNLVQLLVGV